MELLLTLCRSCMVEVASWELQQFDSNDVEIFTFCTNIQVSEDDKLPKQFCCDCKIKLETCYTFIKKAQEVNVKFNNIISWKGTSAIVKCDNLENPLKDNGLNLLHDFDFNSDVQMDETVKSDFTFNSNKNLETEMEINNYSSKLSSPENREIEETLTNTEIDLPEMTPTPNIENFDSHLDKISRDNYAKKVQKIAVKRKYLNCTRNARYQRNKGKKIQVSELDRRNRNNTIRSQKAHELKITAKGKEQSNYENKRFKCSFCKISYKFCKGLQKHLYRKHSNLMFKMLKQSTKDKEQINYEMKRFKCNFCKIRFKFHRSLLNHLSRMHSEATLISIKTSSKGKEQSSDENKRFKCNFCTVSYKFDKGLQKHLITKHSEAMLPVATVKFENLEDTLQDNNSNSTTLSFSSDVKMEENHENMSTSNANLCLVIKEEPYHSSPENSETEMEESLSIKKSNLPEMKLNSNLNDSGTNSDRISNVNSNLDDSGINSDSISNVNSNLNDSGTNSDRISNVNSNLDDSGTNSDRISKVNSNLDDSGTNSDRISNVNSKLDDSGTNSNSISNVNDDPKTVQKTVVKEKDSNCVRNRRRKRNKEKQPKSHGERKYKCNICNNSYTHLSGLYVHCQIKHPETSELTGKESTVKTEEGEKIEIITKIKCGRPKGQKERLEVQEDEEQEKKEANPKATWTCTICGQAYMYTFMISLHYKEHHLDVDNQYTCPHCPKCFSADDWRCFHEHVQTHVEFMQFACSECDARFKFGKELAAHVRAPGHSRPHVCANCGMAFETEDAMTSHTKSHTENVAPFLCYICGIKLKSRTSYANHIKVHSGQRPYACNQCSFRSDYEHSVALHMQRHAGVRKCSCEYCGKHFFDQSAVTKHIRQLHTHERPYQCTLCPQAFTAWWGWKQHLVRRHHLSPAEIPRSRRFVPNLTGPQRPKKERKNKGKRGRPKKVLPQADDDKEKISEPAPQPSTSELVKEN